MNKDKCKLIVALLIIKQTNKDMEVKYIVSTRGTKHLQISWGLTQSELNRINIDTEEFQQTLQLKNCGKILVSTDKLNLLRNFENWTLRQFRVNKSECKLVDAVLIIKQTNMSQHEIQCICKQAKDLLISDLRQSKLI